MRRILPELRGAVARLRVLHAAATARMSGTLRGILYVAGAGVSFALLDSLAKALCRIYPSEMVVWARYFFHVLVMLVILWPAWRGRLVATRSPGLQVLRGLALGMSSVTFFAALALMPQAEATAINAIGPIIVTVVAVLWLGERAPPGTWYALSASFVGVLLIIRPGSSVFSPAALLPLLTAGFGAAYTLLTRRLAGIDNSVATLFIGALVPTVLLCGLMPFYWKTPEAWWHWIGLVSLGAIGAGGHLLVVRAYETASASALAPFSYTHAVAAIPMGFLVFGTFPDRPALLGMLLIVATGVVMALLRGNEAGRLPK
ncbi:MAG TPA: DMT family transporter [Burkholderiaceae bacterium]|nr:DMT family transporter [Burkholderiaceae bacterium]